jgi:hypothetical protein
MGSDVKMPQTRSQTASVNSSLAQTPAKPPPITNPVSYSEGFLDASIISLEVWPEIEAEELKLPPAVQEVADAYAAEFTKLKAPRILKPMPSIGRVALEVELTDRTLNLEVLPAQAVCLAQFERRNELSLAEITEGMGCETETAQKSIGFWIQQKVLQEVVGEEGSGTIVYRLLEVLTGEEDHNKAISILPNPDRYEGIERKQKSEEKAMLETYVLGVVTDFKAVSLSHIKKMMAILTTGQGIRPTDRQIVRALENAVKKGLIKTMEDGKYQKTKRRQ